MCSDLPAVLPAVLHVAVLVSDGADQSFPLPGQERCWLGVPGEAVGVQV